MGTNLNRRVMWIADGKMSINRLPVKYSALALLKNGITRYSASVNIELVD